MLMCLLRSVDASRGELPDERGGGLRVVGWVERV